MGNKVPESIPDPKKSEKRSSKNIENTKIQENKGKNSSSGDPKLPREQSKDKKKVKKLICIESEIKVDIEMIIKKIKGNPKRKYDIFKTVSESNEIKIFSGKAKDNGLPRLIKEAPLNSEMIKKLTNEFDTLKKINHYNIVNPIDYFENEKSHFFVYEHSDIGNLRDLIKLKSTMTEVSATCIIFQLLYAVSYLHKIKLVHRNLNLENIIIKDQSKLIIKITNFIGSTFLKEKKLTKIIGNIFYNSPEMNANNYNEKTDIWSIGVIYFNLLSGEFPFVPKQDQVEKYQLEFNNEIWSEISSTCKDLIQKMLHHDYKTRNSAEELLNHPVFDKYKIKERYLTIDPKIANEMIENLELYREYPKIIQVTLLLLVNNTSIKGIDEIFKAFFLGDVDFDGKITKDELTIVVSSLSKYAKKNLSEDEIEKILNDLFHVMNFEKNEFIGIHEFSRAIITKKKLFSDENLKFAFRYFDIESTGKIKLTDLERIFGEGDKVISRKLLKQMLSDIDLNLDDEVTFDDFKNFIFKKVKM